MTDFAPVGGDADRKFAWCDTDGLTPREPLVLKVHAAEDEAPRIVAPGATRSNRSCSTRKS